jgi:hypothetical protein
MVDGASEAVRAGQRRRGRVLVQKRGHGMRKLVLEIEVWLIWVSEDG